MSKLKVEAPDGLVRLEKSQIKAASLMMARAFHDDPMVAYMFAEKGGDDPRLYRFYESGLRIGVYTGTAFTTSSRLEGAAVWQRGEGVIMSVGAGIFSGTMWPMLRMGMGPARRMQAFFKTLGERHNALMPGLHWYLMLLGVEPEHQGKGHAARLVRGMYDAIDAEGLPAYLETETEGNAAMYEHLGFRVLEEVVPTGTGVKMWLMLRDGKG